MDASISISRAAQIQRPHDLLLFRQQGEAVRRGPGKIYRDMWRGREAARSRSGESGGALAADRAVHDGPLPRSSRDADAAQQREPAQGQVCIEVEGDEGTLIACARPDGTDLPRGVEAGRVPQGDPAAAYLSLDPGAQLFLCVEPLHAVVVPRRRPDGQTTISRRGGHGSWRWCCARYGPTIDLLCCCALVRWSEKPCVSPSSISARSSPAI